MSTESVDFGIVGMGVMGKNLLLNIADNGFSVIGLDKDPEKIAPLVETGQSSVQATTSANEFLSSLESPRKIMMLVPAGAAVDAVIEELLPHLDEGDLLMDGGNSYFPDTDRRYQMLTEKGIQYMGVGISGGEEGARHGPSMMPGGSAKAYDMVGPILEAAAAKVDSEPCVTFIGKKSAGNYVKMVHNGIEYALMQLISESYHLMKSGFGLTDTDLKAVYDSWETGELSSFLMEITADIFGKKEEDGSDLILNRILDSARQKGTGKWTSQNAMDLQVPAPTIDMAVMVRDMSAHKKERIAADAVFKNETEPVQVDEELIKKVEHALHFSFITAFAQGFSMIKAASEAYNYGVNLADVAKIWRGGCIIRADMLEEFRRIFAEDPSINNIMVDDRLAGKLVEYQKDARYCIKIGLDAQIPLPAMMASVSYFDLYKSGWLPVNLIQAQRDYFGAHTYERTDKEGTFHTNWK
ncbi:NADP-dependent phosphogluconate dehydrogenase [Aliifodinibius sp. S!AR15-10]|uniref:NADP-dependent phosphogluconate dehydrogenase n=1 Tax=Aliifodinibius sp. S!AR15-10 TaxID=2950437 RepID=UPI0028626239|nr:NADP-dependent phosphogluconate dehydrogenase [Aliifodinibius sp. S!AR15-10]MDR8389548.1 NADP-dependent phosphogluconate dehydrogenase [Aliifodinibius sp. S!AR15-10]